MQTTTKNCTAIGHNTKATYCDNAIAVGDYVEATGEAPCVIGDTLFGLPIPEGVKVLFRQDPESAVWITRACHSHFHTMK